MPFPREVFVTYGPSHFLILFEFRSFNKISVHSIHFTLTSTLVYLFSFRQLCVCSSSVLSKAVYFYCPLLNPLSPSPPPSVVHSTDSGGSRRSSQDSYQGLSDSGSAEEVEECELRGREREQGNPKRSVFVFLLLISVNHSHM